MKVVVDHATCAGYAVCESLNDELFEVEGQGPVNVLVADVPEAFLQDAELAVTNCPTGALRLEG